MCVHVAADDRVTECLHMNAQLMRSTRYGFELDQRAVIATLNDLEVGQRLFSSFVADDLLGSIWPVGGNGQVDGTFILR